MMIALTQMTKPLIRRYFQGFENDPDVYEDVSRYSVYQYSDGAADAYWERQQTLGRIHLAILRGSEPIGEIILKNVDPVEHSCTLSIHLKNDSVKNQGFGTRAEILALEYAFCELGKETVYADALAKNARSCHVLEKGGFVETHQDGTYHYYKCTRTGWHRPDAP